MYSGNTEEGTPTEVAETIKAEKQEKGDPVSEMETIYQTPSMLTDERKKRIEELLSKLEEANPLLGEKLKQTYLDEPHPIYWTASIS